MTDTDGCMYEFPKQRTCIDPIMTHTTQKESATAYSTQYSWSLSNHVAALYVHKVIANRIVYPDEKS